MSCVGVMAVYYDTVVVGAGIQGSSTSMWNRRCAFTGTGIADVSHGLSLFYLFSLKETTLEVAPIDTPVSQGWLTKSRSMLR